MAMIVNINPSENNIDESKRVLEYAALAKEINPLRNKWNISSMDLKSKRKPKKKVDPRIGMSPRSVEIYSTFVFNAIYFHRYFAKKIEQGSSLERIG